MPFGPEIAYPVDFISFMFTKCQNRKPFNYNKLSDFRESLSMMASLAVGSKPQGQGVRLARCAEAARIPAGPKRVPGRLVVARSYGTPTTAISTPVRSLV